MDTLSLFTDQPLWFHVFCMISPPPCPQWVVVEQSCNYYSRVLVPLYDTLGPEAVAYIVNQSNSLNPVHSS